MFMKIHHVLIALTGLLLISCSQQDTIIENDQDSSFIVDSISGAIEEELPPQNDPERSEINATGKVWGQSVFLEDEVAVLALLPLKTQCGERRLVWKYKSDFPYALDSVTLESDAGNLRMSNSFDKLIDASFSSDCKKVYVIASKMIDSIDIPIESRDIYVYDILESSWLALTQKLAPRWDTLDNAKPAPTIIYPLSENKLFVYAMNPTTGGDAYTDQTSKGIFDILSEKLNWIEHGGGLPPAILNFAESILTTFRIDSDGQKYTLVRTDVTLPQGQVQELKLGNSTDFDALVKSLYGSSLSCLRVNYFSTIEYERCMDAFWIRAFPK